MKNLFRFRRAIAWATAVALSFPVLPAHAEDIDIFNSESDGVAGNPNILFVLDNNSNWARNNQHFVPDETQGQAEIDAIRQVIAADWVDSTMNIGVMEWVTTGTANNNGGFIRFGLNAMNATNKASLTAKLNYMYGSVTVPDEKRATSGTQYGALFYDVHNYFASTNQSQNGDGTPPGLPDDTAYSATYSKFNSGLNCDNVCAKTFVIFIGNPLASDPLDDDATNTSRLSALGGSTTQLPLPNFTSSTGLTTAQLGKTSACVPDADATATCPTPGASPWNPYLPLSAKGEITAAAAARTATCNPMVAAKAPGLSANCSDSAAYPFGCAYGNATSGTNDCTVAGTNYYDVNTTTSTTVASGCQNPSYNCPAGATCTLSARSCSGSKKDWDVKITSSSTTRSTACYASAADCVAANAGATSCTNPGTVGTNCAAGTSIRFVNGLGYGTVNTPTGTTTADTGPRNLDEWTRFLYGKGLNVGDSCESRKVASYMIDVYKDQPNSVQTALLMNAARVGGGKYFTASSKSQIIAALEKALQEIRSVNSTFASASLPINATNRAQSKNEVYIGMFRPSKNPRWYGNLKRYALYIDADGVTVKLGDKDGKSAVNERTGFIDDCAISYWTTDSYNVPAESPASDPASGFYWANYSGDYASRCVNVSTGGSTFGVEGTNRAYSDLPDGPQVEKGAVAEVVRKGNSDDSKIWQVNRKFYLIGSGLFSGSTTDLSGLSGLTTEEQKWLEGKDRLATGKDTPSDEDLDGNVDEVRASIHGDVLHSQPLPVDYGGRTVIYYGANDGSFRAVEGSTGKELWAMLHKETATSAFVKRLRDETPLVEYSFGKYGATTARERKSYAWDGSIGLVQDASSNVTIFPTMRRGGRYVAALSATNPESPSRKWLVGCTGKGIDGESASCTGGFEKLGQTWSRPNLGPVKGYGAGKMVAFFGGGYNSCEDKDETYPSCSSDMGKQIFAVDAESGELLNSGLTTEGRVPGDIALLDVDKDGMADYAYAADTKGNIYRIDMVTRTVSGSDVSYTARAPGSWTMRKVAYTSDGRKFLFRPELYDVASAGKVYLAIGSGDREHPLRDHYPYGKVTNRFYVYLDDLNVSSGSVSLDSLKNVTSDDGCKSEEFTPTSSGKGWYFDLDQYGTGEQTVTSALIAGGEVVFSTNRPIPSDSGSCPTYLGEARGYRVGLLTGSGAVGEEGTCGGSRSSTFAGGGLPPSPVIGTVMIGNRAVTVQIGAVLKQGGASTPISPDKLKPKVSPTRKRVYWKQTGND